MLWRRPSRGGVRRDLPLMPRLDRGRIFLRCSRGGTLWNAGPIVAEKSLDPLQRFFHLVEHAEGLLEMGMEVRAHEVQDFDEDGIADGVEDLVAGFSGGDELFGA